MKIKTITCHDVYNAGASLQAFALQEYLRSLGHDVEIIDYKPSYLDHYSLWGGAYGKYNRPIIREAYCIAHLPGRINGYFGKRKKAFDTFREEHLRLTAKTYKNIDELKQAPPDADVYFAGSDQIWNTLFKTGRDPAFYLDFAPSDAVKASYAASFATNSIVDDYVDFVKTKLKNLNFVSVREISGIEILSQIGIKDGINVVDPVFLLKESFWESLTTPAKKEPYLFVYAFEGGELIQKCAVELSNKYNLKIYTLQNLGYGDRCFKNAGPIEFLNLLFNADYVLSNSFHATAFSVIFQKQFYVFNRKDSINTRMRDLTESLGIGGRLLCSVDDMRKNAEYIIYDEVHEKVKAMVKNSQNYIDMVINYAERTTKRNSTSL